MNKKNRNFFSRGVCRLFNNKGTANSEGNWLVVGLGNFGLAYNKTRHNAGFAAVDFLAKKFEISFNVKKKFNALVGTGQVAGIRCVLLKPLTFMNNSGIAVEAAMSFYRLSIENLIVLVDDVLFEPGKIKIKQRGSAGGHNGINSIINSIGSEGFVRIKIGVGQKPRADFDLASWVLAKFDEEALKKMDVANSNVAEAVELILNQKIAIAMNKFN